MVTITRCFDLALLREHVLAWRAEGQQIALVPTMGALHAGHMALVHAAQTVADRVIVTIFVNPTQFAPTEDFKVYPRDLDADCLRVEATGGDLVYAPAMQTMYPDGFATSIEVAGPAKVGLEDRFRPTHFSGVATIVAKLLLQAQPDVALFGQKDFQQFRVIERMVSDLDLPMRILGVPTVREGDGLALSSRNIYLDPDERRRAIALYRELTAAATAIGQGRAIDATLDAARAAVTDAGFAIDYLEARHARSLVELGPDDREGRILVAARLGRTRLIDNVPIERRGSRRPEGELYGAAKSGQGLPNKNFGGTGC